MAAPGPRSNDPETADESACITTIVDTIADIVPKLRTAFETHRSYEGDYNPSGEEMLAADVYADELLESRLGGLDCIGTYASEERADPIQVGTGLSIAVDPLDGSSNLGSNNGVGTIVGIYDGDLPASGHDLVGAMYVLYGPTTTAMVATDDGVTEYLCSDGQREVLTPSVSLPETGTVYGFGGPVPEWPSAFRRYAMSVQRRLKRRYGGALVADVNQVLSHGGVFAYPSLETRPSGKLRLQFEANPIAYIIEQANGLSYQGSGSVLETEPERLHQRTPLFVGSPEPLAELIETLGGKATPPTITTRHSPWE
ncbi:class 1 fructose-bisphosphatase [Halapricum desulfuricans]|uniref:Fructose-1,6-bisphosphatase class 1 n=1 Tax=Halapricum desulfuricans TaxID=2841257 RepID=A0A897NKC0_9EURY|nr:class 1 fructose-bisphosphatase [Halapricum desulfuricans]QSG14920.1 Fructose-1,6-bisphosphatase [Halapricum desulfuricans]